MKKTRMISVIAASLLTATVVFTGCGGGGSSSSVCCEESASSVGLISTPSEASSSISSSGSVVVSSSSTTSISSVEGGSSSACLPGQPCEGTALSSSSSSTGPTIKIVKVSDGWVLGAIVKCKDASGKTLATAVSDPNKPGNYQLVLNNFSCDLLNAINGYMDVDSNGIDVGDPKAPNMWAPGNYENITPYTTLLAYGMTPKEIALSFGLPETTDFDTAIPESDDLNYKKGAKLLSAVLSCIEKGGTSNENVSCPSSIEALVNELKSGKTIYEVLTPELEELRISLESANENEYESVIAQYLAEINGAYGVSVSSVSSTVSSSSSSSVSSESTSSSLASGLLPIPGEGTANIVVVSSSSSLVSENSSSEVSSSVSSSSEEAQECLPGQPCGASSSSSEVSSSVSSSSEEAQECLPGQPCGASSSSSESTASLPGEGGSTVEEGTGNITSSSSIESGECLPGQPCEEISSSESSIVSSVSSSISLPVPGEEGVQFEEGNQEIIISTSSSASSVVEISSSVSSSMEISSSLSVESSLLLYRSLEKKEHL